MAGRGSGASLLLLVPTLALTVLLPKVPFAPKVRTGYNVPISNVPGPVTEMYWNGAHVEEIYPIGTVYDGLTLTVMVCSYADRLGFSYLTSPDVMPNIGEMIGLTERSLAELEAAVGVALMRSRTCARTRNLATSAARRSGRVPKWPSGCETAGQR